MRLVRHGPRDLVWCDTEEPPADPRPRGGGPNRSDRTPGRGPAGGWPSATGWAWLPRQACGSCPPCRAGDPRGCANHRWRHLRVDSPRHRTGALGWVRRGPVPVARQPAGVRSRRISKPSLACMYNAVANGIRWGAVVPGTKPGDVVAVLGPGVRGLSAAAAAKEAGARFVMVTGHGARDSARLRLASDFGADLAVDVAVDGPGRRPAPSRRRPGRCGGGRHRHGSRAPSPRPLNWLPTTQPSASPASTGTAPFQGSAPTSSSSSSCGSSGPEGTDLPGVPRRCRSAVLAPLPVRPDPPPHGRPGPSPGASSKSLAGESDEAPPPFAALVIDRPD